MKNEYIDPQLNELLGQEMTKATAERIREQIKPFKRVKLYSVDLYAGVIKPLLRAGQERKKLQG
jgi:hypothetical protein